MAAADDLIRTPAEQAALIRLRELAGTTDGPMERHCVRCYTLAEEVARRKQLDIDREVLLVAAFFHDAALYLDGTQRHAAYVTDSRVFATEIGEAHGWDAERITRCADTIERHHEPTPQWSYGNEVEVLRRADLMELVPPSAPLVGLDFGFLRGLWRRVPRKGLYGHIAMLVTADVRRAGPGVLPGIFLPR